MPDFGSVEYFAGMIRETLGALSVRANRIDHVDTVTTGVLRSLVQPGPETDAEVRAWFRNALDAGDLVRAELNASPAADWAEPYELAPETHPDWAKHVRGCGGGRQCRCVIPEAERPDPNHACAAHDDAHLGQPCPDLLSAEWERVDPEGVAALRQSAERLKGGE